MRNSYPVIRMENIVVQELQGEILIYDTKSNSAYCLNETAAEVWKMADGTKSIKQISEGLSKKFRVPVSEDFVVFALDSLAKDNLLDGDGLARNFEAKPSRREALRRMALASAVVIPVVTSLFVPNAVAAASACPSTGTACRCRYSSVPTDTSCVNNDPLECASANCRCFFGPNPALACSEITPGNVVCLGVCQT